MPHLDALRFFAALLIVVFHFQVHLDLGRWNNIVQERARALPLFVDLFFVISGFVITRFYGSMRTAAEFGGFMQKRFARLAPLHWATLASLALVGGAVARGWLSTKNPEMYDFRRLPANALALHSWWSAGLSFNMPSWSISAEWTMYALFPLILALQRRGLTLATAAMLFVGLSLLPGERWYYWMSHLGAVRALPSFLLGVGLYDVRQKLARIPFAAIWCVASMAAFIIGACMELPPPLLLLCLYAVVMFAIGADYGAGPRRLALLLSPLGTLTYSIYMLHQIVLIGGVTFLGERILHLSGASLNLWIIAAIASTIPIGYLSLEFFEKPMRRALSRRAVQRPKAAYAAAES